MSGAVLAREWGVWAPVLAASEALGRAPVWEQAAGLRARPSPTGGSRPEPTGGLPRAGVVGAVASSTLAMPRSDLGAT